jgi:hypothetical protein
MASINKNVAWISRYYVLLTAIVSLAVVPFTMVQAATTASTVVSSALCGIIGTIQTVVGVIALALFILGGAFYAIAHMMPAAGNLRGNLQGWSLGMIVGGIVGLIIVIIAPGIISTIASTAGSTTLTSCV